MRFGWCAPQCGRLPLWAGVSFDCPDLFSGTGRSIADALLVLRKTLRAATGCRGSPDLWLEFAFGQKPAESTRDSAGLRGAKASARQSVDCHCRKNSSAVGQAGATHFVILSASEESICCRDTDSSAKIKGGKSRRMTVFRPTVAFTPCRLPYSCVAIRWLHL